MGTMSTMTPERWNQVREILDAALDRDPVDRPAFLVRACEGDPLLRQEVEELLSADSDYDLSEEPFFSLRARNPQEGRRLGVYCIVREIGRGGMGAVYLAARQDDFDKRVAVKLLKRGMDTDEIIARFKNERQILARLEHPHIARLHDGGGTDDGLPYFVMEYVEGEPVDRYCDVRGLQRRDRLELFRKICSAVHFAHQNLIVHRDLKPANVLVTADGTPKLLDFGIAKILSPDSGQSFTQLEGSKPMTPEYASPEQVRGGAVTTASDVYSLGILLCEVLTGRRDPDPRVLRGLSRDLADIVQMATHEEPSERYDSAERLSEDVDHHLRGFPVRASGGGPTYRVGKFVRRHKLGVTVTAAVSVLVLSFSIVITILWRLAVEERKNAVRAKEQAERVSDFLIDIFKVSDPVRNRGKLPSVRDLLDRGREQISEGLEGDPELGAALMEIMGRVYRNLALYEEAGSLLEESLQLRRELPEAEALARNLHNLARLYLDMHAYDKAEPFLVEALTIQRRHGLRKDPDYVRGLTNLATLYKERGDVRQAEQLFREIVELKRRLFGEDHSELATALNNLGALMIETGRRVEGEPLVRRALEIRRETYGEVSVPVALTLNNLGQSLERAGDRVEAEKSYRESLSIRQQIYGEAHPKVALGLNNLASYFHRQGEYQRAEELYREALEIYEKGPPHRNRAVVLRNLAALLAARGAYARCRETVHEALAIYRQTLPETHWRTADARSVLGGCLVGLGLLDEAEPLLDESYPIIRHAQGDETHYTRDALTRLDELNAARRRAQGSESEN